jgi:hypothetical protein
MSQLFSRRHFIVSATAACATPVLLPGLAFAQGAVEGETVEPVPPGFPSQDLARVKEMVGASHGNLDRVRELLGESPALAKATYDWGYGDWETALGAASHVGNREIAALLIANGARPDLFTFAMLGQLDVVKASISASPGIQRALGPHGLTLLHHADKGGEPAAAVVAFLEQLGDADIGHTSLPLTDEQKRTYAGDYAFGAKPSQVLRIGVNKSGTLGITRQPDGVSRVLYHQGNHEFHPAGAPAVRLRFAVENGNAVGLSVLDGGKVLSARRV